MTRRLVFTERARADLVTIHAYLLHHAGVDVAARLRTRIQARCRELVQHSNRGNVPPELHDTGERGWRELHEPPYRIVYRVDDEVVTIALIADARRDFRALLAERLLR